MIIKRILIFCLACTFFTPLSSQVKVRVFSDTSPLSALLTVDEGEYLLDAGYGKSSRIRRGELVFISRAGNRLAVKIHNGKIFLCDSLYLSGSADNSRFSLREGENSAGWRRYDGDLKCIPDLGSLLLINICDADSYISGVVMAEGGPGRHPAYLKTQAVIARTYMYRHMNRHLSDGFNLCDNIHCQAFKGITTDPIVQEASISTRNEVIAGPDSALIIAAFHSNCGGETVCAGDVWLTPQPYLTRITDPHCLNSRNALWRKSITLTDWINYLIKSGCDKKNIVSGLLNFSQKTRLTDYKAGDFSMPLKQIRDHFGLRSTFFSVAVEGDSVILKGRGYGHGVGLCQEGAIEMALKGFSYRQIIGFYYPGVKILGINEAKPVEKPPL
ncbi:MAG: SpoIID/LytB domain-containing protein [Bacteroidales bacterium]|nr:SpoIID/LytB domain-containing protein [Bacteroidales bacterium]